MLYSLMLLLSLVKSALLPLSKKRLSKSKDGAGSWNRKYRCPEHLLLKYVVEIHNNREYSTNAENCKNGLTFKSTNDF